MVCMHFYSNLYPIIQALNRFVIAYRACVSLTLKFKYR